MGQCDPINPSIEASQMTLSCVKLRIKLARTLLHIPGQVRQAERHPFYLTPAEGGPQQIWYSLLGV